MGVRNPKKGLIISVLLGIYFRILHRLDCVETPFTFSGKAYESAFLSLQGWGCVIICNFISINLYLFDIIKTNLVNSIIWVKVQPGIDIFR